MIPASQKPANFGVSNDGDKTIILSPVATSINAGGSFLDNLHISGMVEDSQSKSDTSSHLADASYSSIDNNSSLSSKMSAKAFFPWDSGLSISPPSPGLVDPFALLRPASKSQLWVIQPASPVGNGSKSPRSLTLDQIAYSVTVDSFSTKDDHVVFNIRVSAFLRSVPSCQTSWAVSRRYREFESLHATLLTKNPLPNLPGKKILNNFEDKFLEERRIALELYLRLLLDLPVTASRSIQLKEFLGIQDAKILSRMSVYMDSKPSSPSSNAATNASLIEREFELKRAIDEKNRELESLKLSLSLAQSSSLSFSSDSSCDAIYRLHKNSIAAILTHFKLSYEILFPSRIAMALFICKNSTSDWIGSRFHSIGAFGCRCSLDDDDVEITVLFGKGMDSNWFCRISEALCSLATSSSSSSVRSSSTSTDSDGNYHHHPAGTIDKQIVKCMKHMDDAVTINEVSIIGLGNNSNKIKVKVIGQFIDKTRPRSDDDNDDDDGKMMNIEISSNRVVSVCMTSLVQCCENALGKRSGMFRSSLMMIRAWCKHDIKMNASIELAVSVLLHILCKYDVSDAFQSLYLFLQIMSGRLVDLTIDRNFVLTADGIFTSQEEFANYEFNALVGDVTAAAVVRQIIDQHRCMLLAQLPPTPLAQNLAKLSPCISCGIIVYHPLIADKILDVIPCSVFEASFSRLLRPVSPDVVHPLVMMEQSQGQRFALSVTAPMKTTLFTSPIWTVDTATVYHFIRYSDLLLNRIVNEDALVELSRDILLTGLNRSNGASGIPVGEIGKLLQETVSCDSQTWFSCTSQLMPPSYFVNNNQQQLESQPDIDSASSSSSMSALRRSDCPPVTVSVLDEMGSIMTMFLIPYISFTAAAKEQFGGLKKFLERYPQQFSVADNHPFNPQVRLAHPYQNCVWFGEFDSIFQFCNYNFRATVRCPGDGQSSNNSSTIHSNAMATPKKLANQHITTPPTTGNSTSSSSNSSNASSRRKRYLSSPNNASIAQGLLQSVHHSSSSSNFGVTTSSSSAKVTPPPGFASHSSSRSSSIDPQTGMVWDVEEFVPKTKY